MTDLVTALHELPDNLQLVARADLAQRVRRRADRARRRQQALTALTTAACVGLAFTVISGLDNRSPRESLPAGPATSPTTPSSREDTGEVPSIGQSLTVQERAELLASWEARAQQAGASQGLTGPRPPFAYVRMDVLSEHVLPGYRYGVEGQRQLWLADDGTGRGRQKFTPTGVRFWSEKDRQAADQADGARPQDFDGDMEVSGAARTLRNAPPDPEVLRRALRQGAGDLGDAAAFTVGEVALLPPAPSPEWAVRAAAAIGGLDGVDWRRGAQLPDGREGIALVARVEGAHGMEERRLLLREDDGQLLGTLVVRDGTLTGYAIPSRQGFVENVRSTP